MNRSRRLRWGRDGMGLSFVLPASLYGAFLLSVGFSPYLVAARGLNVP